MSEPIPEILVPDGNSQFNNPSGNGFVAWFAALKSSIAVALVEVRNQAVSTANDFTNTQLGGVDDLKDTVLGTEVNVTVTDAFVTNHDHNYKLIKDASGNAALKMGVEYVLELIPSESFILSDPLQMGDFPSAARMVDTLAGVGTAFTAAQPFMVPYTPTAEGLYAMRLIGNTAKVPVVNVYTPERAGGLVADAQRVNEVQDIVSGEEAIIPQPLVTFSLHTGDYYKITSAAVLQEGVEYLLEFIPSATFTVMLQMGTTAAAASMVDTLDPAAAFTAGTKYSVWYTPTVSGLLYLRLLGNANNISSISVSTFGRSGGLVADVERVQAATGTEHITRRINGTLAGLRALRNEVDGSLSALTQVQTSPGVSQEVTVSDVKSRLMRVGLHYGPSRYAPSDTEVFFDGACRTDFTDVRFFDASGKMLKAQLGELVNLELLEDPNLNRLRFFTSNGTIIGYSNGIQLSSDNGATYTTIAGTTNVTANASDTYKRLSMYPVFVDAADNIFAYAGGILYKLLASDGYATKTPVLNFSWTPAGGSIIYPDIQNHAMDADSNGVLFMGIYQARARTAVYRSTDGGNTFTEAWMNTGNMLYQHVHHIHADKYSNKVYVGVDDGGTTFNGAHILVTEDGGNTWVDITDNNHAIRGRDYYPTYFGDGYRLGGGEAYYNGGAAVIRSEDDVNYSTPVKGVGGVRSYADFGTDDLIVTGVQLANGTSENQILVSEDQGKSWTTIYRKFQTPMRSSGVGFRDNYDAVLIAGDTEPCAVLTAGSSSLSTVRVYQGGDHFYREAFILLDEVPTGPVTVTVKTGYMMGYPYRVLDGAEHPGLVYHVPLNEGTGRAVSDSEGNTVRIDGDDFTWDTSEEPARYGDYGGEDLPSPFMPSAGLKLTQGTTINFGKIAALDFDSSFTITCWINPDGLLMNEGEYNNRMKCLGILSAGDVSFFSRFNKFGYSTRTMTNSTFTASGYEMMESAINGYGWSDQYFFVAIVVNADGTVQTYINGTTIDYVPESLGSVVAANLSTGDFVLGSEVLPSAGFLSEVKVYDRVIGAAEILEMYRGA